MNLVYPKKLISIAYAFYHLFSLTLYYLHIHNNLHNDYNFSKYNIC